jgi:Mn-dependent DtxR family transcriptional regulator
MDSILTHRDREYLRVIFSLNGSNLPVGPADLAKSIGVSKECAYQKMRRLSHLGYGDYHLYKGFQLNKKAIDLVEEDTKRHHILEHFLQKTLHIDHQQACTEASKMDATITANIYRLILDRFALSEPMCCGYNPSQRLTPGKIKQCPWFQQIVETKN